MFRKDPDAVLDYTFDWTQWLADTETITDFTVTAPSGITLDSSSETDGMVTAWLSEGTAGVTYTVGCLIETTAGRTDERSIRVLVTER